MSLLGRVRMVLRLPNNFTFTQSLLLSFVNMTFDVGNEYVILSIVILSVVFVLNILTIFTTAGVITAITLYNWGIR